MGIATSSSSITWSTTTSTTTTLTSMTSTSSSTSATFTTLTSSTTSTTTTTTSTDISVWVREVANDQSVALNLTLSKLFDVLLSEVDGKESMTGSISRYLLALDSIVQLAVQIAHRGQHHTQESNASAGGQVENNLVKQVPIMSRAAAAVDR